MWGEITRIELSEGEYRGTKGENNNPKKGTELVYLGVIRWSIKLNCEHTENRQPHKYDSL
jgi:hypothetical protein